MNRDGHKGATLFVGGEVEHTPAFSKRTLFVVGYQNTDVIEKAAKGHKVSHIFFGANHSFDTSVDFGLAAHMNKQITHFLNMGLMVTLDYQAHQHEIVLKMLDQNIWDSRLFIPMLSVRIPKFETSNMNLTVKIDDVDFNATNPGVWCHHFHSIADSNRFTSWEEYSGDSVLAAVAPVADVVKANTEEVVGTAKTDASFKEFLATNAADLGLDTEDEKPVPMPPFADPVDAEVSAPAPIDITQLKRIVETPVQNETDLGLDPDGKSQLKQDAPQEVSKTDVEETKSVVEVYTETQQVSDPISTEKKAAKKKDVK